MGGLLGGGPKGMLALLGGGAWSPPLAPPLPTPMNYFIPSLPEIANLSMKYFILSKIYTDEGEIK